MNYTNKVAIITGGSKGIGEGCVRAFVAAGARVIFCARSEETGQDLANEVNQLGPGEANFIRCDVSKVEEIQKLIDTTVARYRRLDCLINNAGWQDRKSTRLNSSHPSISYAVFCLKKKNQREPRRLPPGAPALHPRD